MFGRWGGVLVAYSPKQTFLGWMETPMGQRLGSTRPDSCFKVHGTGTSFLSKLSRVPTLTSTDCRRWLARRQRQRMSHDSPLTCCFWKPGNTGARVVVSANELNGYAQTYEEVQTPWCDDPTHGEVLPGWDGKPQKESVSAGDVSWKSTIKSSACGNEWDVCSLNWWPIVGILPPLAWWPPNTPPWPWWGVQGMMDGG